MDKHALNLTTLVLFGTATAAGIAAVAIRPGLVDDTSMVPALLCSAGVAAALAFAWAAANARQLTRAYEAKLAATNRETAAKEAAMQAALKAHNETVDNLQAKLGVATTQARQAADAMAAITLVNSQKLHEAVGEKAWGLEQEDFVAPMHVPQGCELRCDVSNAPGALIEGRLVGSVHATGAVVVTLGAEVEGTIKARVVIVQGTTNASIEADAVHVRPSGAVHGDITYRRTLIIDEGGVGDGMMRRVSQTAIE